jgi:DNA primase
MTLDEMTEVLSRLDIEVIGNRGDEIQAHCPAHVERTGKEDRNPSWYINADSGVHNCFSCGWKGSLYSLVSYVTGTDYDKATEWLGSSDGLLAKFNRITREAQAKIEEPSRITESMMSAFTNVPLEVAKARGLSVVDCEVYGVRWDDRNNNWIIPIRDPISNKLLGWQEKGHDRRYFKNVPSGVKKAVTLFGYNQYKRGDMIVVESPLDVVRLASVGITGGVATYGAIVSHPQFNMIRGADRIIFAMDNDDAGRASSRALLNMCHEFGAEAWFFDYGSLDVKDVGGMSLDEIQSGLENAKHMIKGDKAI